MDRIYLWKFLLVICLISLCAASCEMRTDEYYVSPLGSDAGGDGSLARPWQTVQYALDHMDYAHYSFPRLNLSKGIYHEPLTIEHDVRLKGVGDLGPDAPASGGPPNIPAGEVSVIEGDLNISGASNAWFEDMVFLGDNSLTGRTYIIWALFTKLYFTRIQVRNITYRSGLSIYNSPQFLISDSAFVARDGYHAVTGLEIYDSVGNITNTTFEGGSDPAIYLGPRNRIDLNRVTVVGNSDYSLSRGVLIANGGNIRIRNSSVIRPNGQTPPANFNPHDHLYNNIGISIAGLADEPGQVSINDVSIAGFDIGVGIGTIRTNVFLQGNDISASLYPVHIVYDRLAVPVHPMVDMGGGSLHSTGGNTFYDGGDFAVYLDHVSYEVFACSNDWMVPDSEIPNRIWDRYDDTSVYGEVYFTCP